MHRFALLLIVFLPVAAWGQDRPGRITVNATGVASAAPDMAVVRLGVSREARAASEAMAAASAAAAQVLERIADAGIAQRDVQTASIGLNPVWDHSNTAPPRIRGYVASNDLTVRVRDLAKLGGLLDSVVADGANTMNGLTFGVADAAPLEQAARADAVRQARAIAETLANAAGVTLGPVLSIQEGGGVSDPAPLMRGAMMEADVPIAAGELDFRISVTMVFAMAD